MNNAITKNLSFIRSMPVWGQRVYETFKSIMQQQATIAQQTNSNPNGNQAPPPPLGSITVTPTSTGHHISLTHPGEFYRGVEYHAVYADNPAMTNPFPVYMGPSREHDVATGNKTLYFGAFPQYPTGDPGGIIYHGGAQPIAVTGGTESPLGKSQGSGTGQPGQLVSGHGPIPFRGSTPPVRS